MNSEKQHGISIRRPASSVYTRSPKVSGRDTPLAKNTASPMTNGFPNLPRERQDDNKRDESGSMEEAVATPIKSFLNSNVTPRSVSRKARAETSSPTLNGTSNGTPTSTRPSSSHGHNDRSVDSPRAASGLGLRISHGRRRSRTSSMISDDAGSSISSKATRLEYQNSAARISPPENGPKFFYANDVKATVPSRPTLDRFLSKEREADRTSSLGGDELDGRTSSMKNEVRSEEPKSKFCYANSHSDSRKPDLFRSNGADTLIRPPLQTIYSAQDANSPPRASSPLKEEILPRKPSISKASPRRHTRLVSNGGTEIKSPEGVGQINGDLRRRSSLNSLRQSQYGAQNRSPSVQSTGPRSYRRSSIVASDTSPNERGEGISVVGSNGALPHSVNPPALTQEVPKSPVRSEPRSPTKPSFTEQSKIDQMNELAANARRERKVLDLEISNSSLLAINRTLEREMRKQNVELRRFRRLSRTGRMSIAPSRSVSGVMSILSESDTNVDSEDLMTASDGDDNDDSSSDVSSPDVASQSSSPTQRTARARFHDPKQVELDLAAHRTLLLDSQKLNFSIRRCVDRSEAMIASAKRALEYRAEVSNQENFTARVLTPDDVEDDSISQGQGLLSPSVSRVDTNPWERTLSLTQDLEDGLETPDYSTWGPATEVQTPFLEEPKASETSLVIDGVPGYKDTDDIIDDPGSVESIEQHKASETASLDGLDDEPTNEATSHKDGHVNAESNNKGTVSDSCSVREERSRSIKPPDPQPGQPGYRGSMQGLGHYLQAFSIFGTSQQT